MAIQVLAKANVRPENIMFLNLICAPEGLKALTDEYPQVEKHNVLRPNISFCQHLNGHFGRTQK